MPPFGSLFTGIGGIDLGLERAGWECKWQVEIDEFCQKILAKHWPNVPKFGDVRQIKEGQLEHVDLIAGGFPCQPVSTAGKRKGREDERWLWPEMARIVRMVRPRFVLVENVPGILSVNRGKQCLKFSETWPKAGMMRNGICYRQPCLAHRTDATGSSLLVTTPTQMDAHGGHRSKRFIRKTLTPTEFARMWPSPSVFDAKEEKLYFARLYRTRSGNLRRGLKDGTIAHSSNVGLAYQVGGQLNPMWVEWLMGFPIAWTALDASETQSSHKSRNGSEK